MADTAIRTVRMDDPLWDRFGDATDDRSAVIRQFVHWYVGDEGWEMPERPTRLADPINPADGPPSAA